MTRVDFHFNAPDKVAYGCRLLRKVHRAGQRAVVSCAEPSLLERLDLELWTFSPLDFIPHVWAEDRLAPRTPVLLATAATRAEALPHHDVLVNLGGDRPSWFSSFDRLIEVVAADDADRAQARERWRFYRERGYALTPYDLAAPDGAGSREAGERDA